MVREKTKVDEIWDKALVMLKDKLPESCDVWIRNFVPNALDGNEFSVLYGQRFALQSITPYLDIFSSVLTEIIGQQTTFNAVFDNELAKIIEKKTKNAKREDEKNLNKYEGLKQMHSAPNLNLKFTFENFVVGSNSELAYAGAYAVAKNPKIYL